MNLHSIARPEPTRWWPLFVEEDGPCDAAYTTKFCRHLGDDTDIYNHHMCIHKRFRADAVYCECQDCLDLPGAHYVPRDEDDGYICLPCRNGDHLE